MVLDTDVLVAAIRSNRGASRVLLEDVLHRRHQMLASVPLMLEYEAVLTRPEHLKAAGLSREDIDELLDALAMVVEPVRLAFLWRPILPDPDDDMVLETAMNGMADLLVTLNGRHFQAAAARFAVKIVSPGNALEWLRARS